MAWFERIDLEIHPGFEAELENRLDGSTERRGTPEKESLTSQERTTLLKLIAAMVCEQYSFDPNNERSEATSRLQEDLATVGLSMDPKTIRKWLKEATNLVPKDYWTQG